MYCTYVFHLDTNGNIDNLEYTEASYILFISFSQVGVFMLTHDKYYTLFVMDNRVFYYSLETIIGVLYILSVYICVYLLLSIPCVHHYLCSPLWLAVVHEAEAAAVRELHLGQELLRAHRGHCHGEAGVQW